MRDDRLVYPLSQGTRLRFIQGSTSDDNKKGYTFSEAWILLKSFALLNAFISSILNFKNENVNLVSKRLVWF